MKNIPALALFRLIAFAALSALPSLGSDRAAELLARQGSVPVSNAGRYVEVGTMQIQVSSKLGRPTARLADGTWLYAHHEVEESAARGTLVVRFTRGRVSELALVTPAIASAMAAPRKPADQTMLAQGR